MQARYYDAEVGRFLSVDPVASVSGSRYAYVNNNPLGYIDPDGRQAAQQNGQSDPEVPDPCDLKCKQQRQEERRRKNNEVFTGGGLLQTLSYLTVDGGQGDRTWVVQWRLSEKSKNGGWIVQEITVNDLTGLGSRYWEAWKVNANSRYTSYYPDPRDDTFMAPTFGTSVQARAAFYEGLQLPSSFIRNNPATSAGELPSTAVNPYLPASTTVPIDRVWSWW